METYGIVIVTYNRAALLQECLMAVETQTAGYDLIVVVDNASTDDTRRVLEEKKDDPRYRIIHEDENRGGAGGFALGLQEAYEDGADWITLIDDDSILRPDFLEQILRGIEKYRERYSCFAGVPLTNGIRPGHRRIVKGRLIKKEYPVELSEYDKELFLCDIASFCGLVIHRSVVEKAGYPMKELFIWFDDTEYCLRISRFSKIANVNGAVIDHKASLGTGRDGEVSWKDYYGIRNRIYMAGKHYGFPTELWIVFRKILRCALECVKLLFRGNIQEARKVYCLYRDGIYDGIRGRLGKNPGYLPRSLFSGETR